MFGFWLGREKLEYIFEKLVLRKYESSTDPAGIEIPRRGAQIKLVSKGESLMTSDMAYLHTGNT